MYRFAIALTVVTLASAAHAADEKERVLFDFAGKDTAKDWAPVKLPELTEEQPAPRVDIVAQDKATR